MPSCLYRPPSHPWRDDQPGVTPRCAGTTSALRVQVGGPQTGELPPATQDRPADVSCAQRHLPRRPDRRVDRTGAVLTGHESAEPGCRARGRSSKGLAPGSSPVRLFQTRGSSRCQNAWQRILQPASCASLADRSGEGARGPEPTEHACCRQAVMGARLAKPAAPSRVWRLFTTGQEGCRR